MNTSTLLNRLFRKIDTLSWDLMSGKVGLNTQGGIATLVITPAVAAVPAANGQPAVEASPASFQVSVNPIDSMGMSIPAFAFNTPMEKANIGDLIYGAKEPLGWLIGKNEKSIGLMDHNGHVKTYVPPKTAILGQDGIMVVQNLGSMFGNEGVAGLGGLLTPLLLMGGGTDKISKILPFILMQGMGAAPGAGAGQAFAGMNPMMLAMMAEGEGDMDPMMMAMMMGGGGSGGNGMQGYVQMLMMSKLLGGGSAPAALGSVGRSVQNLIPPLKRL